VGLADTGEHNFFGVASRGEHASELAARNDVEAAAQTREQVENGEVRIGFNGVADQVRSPGERRVETAERCLERGARIDIARRAEAGGNRGKRKPLGGELAVTVLEGTHCFFSADVAGRSDEGSSADAGAGEAGAAGAGADCCAGGSFSGPLIPHDASG